MAKKATARGRGRPRQFGEREVITLAMPLDLLRWLDAAAAEAGVSRTRLTVELLGTARLLHGSGFVSADAEGTHFTSVPDPEALRRMIQKGIGNGDPVPRLRFHVLCDEVVAEVNAARPRGPETSSPQSSPLPPSRPRKAAAPRRRGKDAKGGGA